MLPGTWVPGVKLVVVKVGGGEAPNQLSVLLKPGEQVGWEPRSPAETVATVIKERHTGAFGIVVQAGSWVCVCVCVWEGGRGAPKRTSELDRSEFRLQVGQGELMEHLPPPDQPLDVLYSLVAAAPHHTANSPPMRQCQRTQHHN